MSATMATAMMRVIQIHRYGGPEELQLEERPRPIPQAGEALLEVHAAGVNPLDCKIRQGLLQGVQPVTFPYTLGIEAAGVVEAVGAGVTDFAPGQAVYGSVAGGAYAEYVAVPSEALAPKPKTLNFVEAAAVPVGLTTAWRTLFDHGGLQAGQRVVIQGAAGGVGLFAVQLAKWKGAEVIATASPANRELVRSLGAETVVDYTTTPLEDVVQDADLALDGVGMATLPHSLAVLKRGGILISIAGPPPLEQAQARGVRALMSRGTASVPFRTLSRLIEEGQLRVTVGKTFALSEARQAHEESERGHGQGRIVLRVVEEGGNVSSST
jgi:NADPH:quinone reductase-like Zn-dependent oxidoreductase